MFGIFLAPKVVLIGHSNSFFPEMFPDLNLLFYSLSQRVMMVNFQCQLDWAIVYPDIWSNSILGFSGRIRGPSKADRPLHPISRRSE